MILPDPLLFDKPLHLWLGLVTLLLLIFQILVGAQIIKLPFWTHKKLIWIILLTVALIHGFYGFEIYFLK